ncbi:MAG: hypothetical protein ABIF82_02300 [Planctomycetota bacterium]
MPGTRFERLENVALKLQLGPLACGVNAEEAGELEEYLPVDLQLGDRHLVGPSAAERRPESLDLGHVLLRADAFCRFPHLTAILFRALSCGKRRVGRLAPVSTPLRRLAFYARFL